MPLSQFIEDLLKSNEQTLKTAEVEFTPQYGNELIEEADNGNQRAQYYVGVCIL